MLASQEALNTPQIYSMYAINSSPCGIKSFNLTETSVNNRLTLVLHIYTTFLHAVNFQMHISLYLLITYVSIADVFSVVSHAFIKIWAKLWSPSMQSRKVLLALQVKG